jgi:hypothetical protein
LKTPAIGFTEEEPTAEIAELLLFILNLSALSAASA